ncbi:MAG TPA: metallophosphoesterase [Chlamydiales bacterium]|nr:metallophosphoesterase [Chlamydiales bacterium]
MRIAHLSDIHFTQLTFNPLRLFPKRIFGHLNWLIHRRKYFNHQMIDLLPNLFRELHVDLVLFAGDFTSSSLHSEFMIAKKWMSKLPIPWIAIPGNHDHYTRTSAHRYYQYFESLKPHPIGNNWWVIPMDTTCPNPIRSSKGIFSNAAQLEELLNQISGNVILLNHYPFFQQESKDRSLEGGEELEQLIRKHPKIKLYLHGHTHRHSIADLQVDNLPIILDSGSCSLRKGSWNLIDLSEDGCNVTPYTWQNTWTAKEIKEFKWKR